MHDIASATRSFCSLSNRKAIIAVGGRARRFRIAFATILELIRHPNSQPIKLHFFPGMDSSPLPPQPDRRNFLTKASAVVIGAALALVAPVAGLMVFLDPLRRQTAAGGAVLVASLDSLAENGEPQKFSVLATRIDAWNTTPNVPVGAVYLQRLTGRQVRAFNVVCPHAGCFVDFREANNCFHCPCHNSSFSLDGKVLDPKSPSPRGLDDLLVEVRNGTEIWVHFKNFRAGEKARIPV